MISKSCPYKITDEDHKFFPENTCTKKWSYCTHCGKYEDCDLYKRHNAMLNNFLEAMNTIQV